MSKKRHNKREDQKHADGDKEASCHSGIRLPSVCSVKVESSPEDEKKYAVDQVQKGKQLNAAQLLNWITGIGTGVGLLGLFFLYQSFRISQTAMITSTRAYLGLAQVRIYCPVCDSGELRPPIAASPNDNNASISAFFINSGHSPGREIAEGMQVYAAPMEKNFTFHEQTDAIEQPKHMAIQGSTEFPLEIVRGIRAELVLDARGKIPCGSSTLSPPCPTQLYVYGHVSYTDVFKQRHTLLYCAHYDPASNTLPEQWNACPEHNNEYDGDYSNPPE